jgi:hypothetical protein
LISVQLNREISDADPGDARKLLVGDPRLPRDVHGVVERDLGQGVGGGLLELSDVVVPVGHTNLLSPCAERDLGTSTAMVVSKVVMARSAGAFVVAAVMIASGCMGSSSPPTSHSARAFRHGRHRATVPVGRSRAYRAGALAFPLTVVCTNPSPTGDLKQVIRKAPDPDTSALYSGGQISDTLVVAVSDEAVRVKCDPLGAEPSRTKTVLVPKEQNAWIGAFVPRLHRAGLRVSIPRPWGLTSFDGPVAFYPAPRPGTRVPAGSVVSVRVVGVLGSPWQRVGRHVVPDVSGESLDQAAKRIYAAGLPWRVRASPLPPTSTSDLFSAYCVTSQTPSSGTVNTTSRGNHQIRLVELQARPC